MLTEFQGPIVYGTRPRILPKWASSTFTNCPVAIFQTYRFFLQKIKSNQVNINVNTKWLLYWTYRTPATANSPPLLNMTLFECSNLTEIFRTPVGSFKSTRLPSAVRQLSTENTDTFQMQKPSAVVPNRWVSSSLKWSWSNDSPPSTVFLANAFQLFTRHPIDRAKAVGLSVKK